MYNVLVEGIGSMVFGPQLKYYQEMGWNIVGIDITNQSFGNYIGIKTYIVPRYDEKVCFDAIEEIINNENIDFVFPTVNEGLLEWSKKKQYLKNIYGCNVVISDEEIIKKCVDKWETYNLFINHNIPTPTTSLKNEFLLLKPRSGRGSCGIYMQHAIDQNFNMEGYISQEIVCGEEFTVDILCDLKSNPIYIVPRKRVMVESGVSTQGITLKDNQIIKYCRDIVKALKPIGMINIQCFKNGKNIKFIEINPRLGGGSTLSFASTENWFKAIEAFYSNDNYIPTTITYNNRMFRYYEEVVVKDDKLK